MTRWTGVSKDPSGQVDWRYGPRAHVLREREREKERKKELERAY